MPFPCSCPSLCKQLGGGHYLPSPYLLLWKRLGDCYRLPFPGLSFRNGQEIVIAHPPLSLSSEKPKLTLIAFSLLFNVANLAIYGHFVPFLAFIAMLSFLGSGPDRGRSPVEWGDFPSIRLYVLGHPARPEAQQARPEAQSAIPEA